MNLAAVNISCFVSALALREKAVAGKLLLDLPGAVAERSRAASHQEVGKGRGEQRKRGQSSWERVRKKTLKRLQRRHGHPLSAGLVFWRAEQRTTAGQSGFKAPVVTEIKSSLTLFDTLTRPRIQKGYPFNITALF